MGKRIVDDNSRRAILLQLLKGAVTAGDLSGNAASRYKGNPGRKQCDRTAVEAIIRAVPPEKRSNYRQTAVILGLAVGLIFNMMTNKEIVVRTTTIKLVLKQANRQRRME
ncbi:hypothetical protein L915_05882 [Phytophthora nicotianae]|uniref:Uncharacterized protein n=1 Tax=Phytophthora nicotianae TaxID=4792 RepID=W2H780_PHYNI|nr:hypothetical protein L915_05882 [Phytophthora nicotianae]